MESRLNKIPLAMIFKRSKDRALLEDILSRVARIESTTNFFYDDLELSRQGINLFALAEQLVLERDSEDFKKVFGLNSPKVSVIIPISRKIEILKVSIQSVLSQTHKNLELILVSESPREDVIQFLSELNDNRIKFILNYPFTNATGTWTRWALSGGKSRTLGMRSASGDFFTFLDDDDEMMPNKLADCVEFAKSNSYEVVGHLNGIQDNGVLKPLRLDKVNKTRYFLGGGVDYFGLGSNTIFLHKFFLPIAWPLYNYKNLRGNDSVFVRMIFALNPNYGLLSKILTIKNEN